MTPIAEFCAPIRAALAHVPPHVRIIAEHFGLGPEVLLSPHPEFRALIDGKAD